MLKNSQLESDVCRLPFAVNGTLILSNVEIFYTQEDGFSELCKVEYVVHLAVLKNVEDIISDYPTRNKGFFFRNLVVAAGIRTQATLVRGDGHPCSPNICITMTNSLGG